MPVTTFPGFMLPDDDSGSFSGWRWIMVHLPVPESAAADFPSGELTLTQQEAALLLPLLRYVNDGQERSGPGLPELPFGEGSQARFTAPLSGELAIRMVEAGSAESVASEALFEARLPVWVGEYQVPLYRRHCDLKVLAAECQDIIRAGGVVFNGSVRMFPALCVQVRDWHPQMEPRAPSL